MPITITLHIFGYTVTIRIKGRNRHSAKLRFLMLLLDSLHRAKPLVAAPFLFS